ncbi:MAG: tRNA (adenosine(37)-N6)-threonylcarbamoyltransferase complex ATPase subunit type 1 TsaE [Phycisphaerales bacterium]
MNGERDSIEYFSDSVEATVALGRTIARSFKPGDLVGLIGELGAGKTQMVRGMAGELNITPSRVSSPTFVFLHEYPPDLKPPEIDETDSPVLAHVDAYRLSGTDDLASIGWDGDGQELRRGAVLVVEWADRITDALGNDWLEVRLEHHDAGRRITLSPHGGWRARMATLRADMDQLPKPLTASE